MIRRFGFDWCRFTPTHHPMARRKQLFDHHKIEMVVDVGANTGQFAQELRVDIGYENRIVSFEPLRSAFMLLSANARKDPHWEVFNVALGDVPGKRVLNVASNSLSSSLLSMLPEHVRAAPESKFIDREKVDVKTLDSFFAKIYRPNERVYLKIDTQGFESNVIKGSSASMNKIGFIQMEMSLTQLYEDEMLFPDLCAVLEHRGFSLYGIDPGFTNDQNGKMLQVDGIFISNRLL